MTNKMWTRRPNLRSRVLSAVGLILAATCGGGDGNPPGSLGELKGAAYYGGPLAGATVTVRQYFENQETVTIGTTTTDDEGAWVVIAGTYAGDFLVTLSGGHYVEASGGTVTLDASAVLHAPVQDFQTAEKRADVVVTPLSELVWQLGKARLAGLEDPDYPAAVEHARALLADHVGFDPLATPIAPIDAATAFNEPAKHTLVLAGLSELAATAAADQGVTVQAINTRALLTQLVRDASSTEARFDGNGAEVLSVGASCALVAGCSMEQLGCYASCHVYTNTLRSRLGAAILTWLLRTDRNLTGLDKTDVRSWVTELKDNTDPMLFGAEAPELLDNVGPAVTWVLPAEGALVSGAVAVEVTATDTLGVATIEVHTDTATPIALVDTDPAPERFVATLDTVGLSEGPLRLLATGADGDGNRTTVARAVVADNVDAGTISGVAVKGRLGAAPVRIYTYANGLPGATPVGTGTTATDGSFTNVLIAEGTSGPLVVVVGGGGSYVEEAFPNPTTTLDVGDQLRTVVPAFVDGGAVSGVVVTPLTALAVTYLDYLTTTGAGGATVPARWTTAAAAIEAQFGVANIRDIVPLDPAQMTVLTAAARYGLVLVGISRLAWQASSAGGGDAGSFGSTVNAQKVVNAWNRDLSDGCFDGKLNATAQLTYGGTQAFGDQATRLDLAQAIVSYLSDAAHNPTPFVSASDVLSLLDTLTAGGGNGAIGSCVMTTPGTVGGHVFDDDGDTFDQAAPTIAFRGLTPAEGAFVKGTITVDALATDPDNIDQRPSLGFVDPMIVDLDGDLTDPDARALIDTLARGDGPLAVSLRSEDDSHNSLTATRSYTIDNTPPIITLTSPVTAGGYYRPPVTVSYTITELNLAAATSTVDAAAIANGGAVTADGAHTLVVTATDRAMTTTTATRTFTIDSTAPALTVTAPADGGFVRGPVTMSWTTTDANPGATATATLDGAPITPPHTFDVEGPHTLVVSATDAAGNPAATVTRTFTIDDTAPVLSVTAPASGSYVQAATLTFSATDNFPPTTVTATLDGSPILTNYSLAVPGAHTLVVNATDRAGNAAPTVTRTFTIDNTAPTINVNAPANGSYVRGPLTLTWSIADANPGATTSATLDGVPITSPHGVNVEGSHLLSITGADAAGNAAATVTRMFTLDNTPPVLSVTAPVGGYVRGPVTITFSVTDANPGATATATLDTVVIASGGGTNLEGLRTLVVNATDAAGNAAPTITRMFTIDNTAPTITVSAPGNGTYIRGPLTLTWSIADANPGSTTSATLDSLPITSSHMVTLEGAHVLSITGVDAAGNAAATVTRMFTLDNTPPTINLGAPGNGAYVRGTVTITFSATDNFPPATVTARLNGSPILTGHPISIDGAYTLIVDALDQAGNPATITRMFTYDNTPPTINLTAPGNGSYVQGPIPLTWSIADANPGATTTAMLDGSPITSPHTVTPEGTHMLSITGTDLAGNPAATVTRSFTIDNTPPTITITGVVDGGSYLVGVAIGFGATDGNPGAVATATVDGINHNDTQSVTAQAGHTLVVQATDAAGNVTTESRRFLVDSISPSLNLRSQAPAGSYVKPPFTVIVDGTDNLQMSGVAGLPGALNPPTVINVAATVNGNPITPTGTEVLNVDGSRTRTAIFASAPDGPLAATFNLTDRSGNPATPRSVNVTVDSTAPTNVVLLLGSFVANGGTYWTAQARPTLTGTVTEANPNAVVTILNGATPVGSGTVNAVGVNVNWTAVFTTDVPLSSGFDVTVRITDAAGNFGQTAPVQRIARDTTGPQITSVVNNVFNEANDSVDYPSTDPNRPRHTHSGATIALGAAAPPTCPDVPKYAYLTAVAPQGSEVTANPLAFKWRVVDQSADMVLGGAGADENTFKWIVTHVGSGTATPLYPIPGTTVGGGLWDVTTDLHRDGTQPVPALGVVGQLREGRFDIELRATDKLGNSNTVLRCMNYQPIGVPVKAENPVAASGTGVDALSSYSLAGDSTISQLLNGGHPGAGLMSLTVTNTTSDPVVLTFNPTSGSQTYTESWSFLRVASEAKVTVLISCGTESSPTTTGMCGGNLSGAPPAPPTTQTHTNAPFSATPQLGVRVWGPGSPAVTEFLYSGTCAPGECQRFRVTLSGNATYTVVVGLRELLDARYSTTSSGYTESTQS